MQRFTFPIRLISDHDSGGFVVVFRDLPEAITQGDTKTECLQEAADCLEEAIAARIDDNLALPIPSGLQEKEYLVTLSLQMTFKAILYLLLQESGITVLELAQRLEIDQKEAQKILDPRYETQLSTIDQVLTIFGRKATVDLINV